MKKILLFNGYYTPARKYGGPLTSARNCVKTCSDEYEFYIVAHNHDVGSTEVFPNLHEGWGKVGDAYVYYDKPGEFGYKKEPILKLIEEVKPDLIWFAGILTPRVKLATIQIAKKLRIPVLLSPRGEVSADRVCIKGYKKKPYLLLTKLLGFYRETWYHATSDDEVVGLKKYVAAADDHIFLVPNIGVPIEEPRTNYVKTAGKLRACFIARIHMVKNIKMAVKAVSQMKSDVEFDVYGPLEQPEYWNECMEIAKTAPANVNVKYCGQLEPIDVGATFRKYDCFIFPTINENYGHSIAESLANGVPVVLSKGTTPWDSLDGEAGYVCPLEDVDAFTIALEKLSALDEEAYNKLQESTLAYYQKASSKDNAVAGHKDMFDEIIKRYK